MKLAIEESKKTKGPKHFGAVIVKDKQVIASACTRVYEENDPTKHAEVIAISHAAQALGTKKLAGCVLYSTCEPCMMCTGAMLWSGITEVVYGMSREDHLQGFEHSNHWHQNIKELAPNLKVTSGILREECIQAFV